MGGAMKRRRGDVEEGKIFLISFWSPSSCMHACLHTRSVALQQFSCLDFFCLLLFSGYLY